MKTIYLVAAGALFAASPAMATSQITCAQIPRAEAFLDKLKPGPNTRAAWKHLELAQHAKSDHACVTQLGEVNYFAKKSMRADKVAARHASRIKPASAQ
ncbi:MAG: hypothetical protein ACREFC_06385 [Stellaceae bacterium]